MLIKANCIDTIRQRVNLYDVASSYVSLKRAGAHWRGLSPFNNEKTPSFYVNPDKNVFKCFSSGLGGDLFKFVQLKENLSFVDSVEWLARRYGIPVEYEDGSEAHTNLRSEVFAVNEAARQYFQQNFSARSDLGNFMRQYWTQGRQFDLQTAELFGIGCAEVSSWSLAETLGCGQFSPEALVASGLFYAKEGDADVRRFRARFRGRLMIPIRDVQGRVIAFSGRKTERTPADDPAAEAKYINSPETLVFSKGHVLFNLDFARKHFDACDHAILVEGQLDAMRCWEHGLRTVVAPQGTAITDTQLSMLRRYTGKLLCVLDGDGAGQRAALRLLPMAFKAGFDVKFLNLPEGKDPDTFLKENGKEAWERLQGSVDGAMVFLKKHLTSSSTVCSPQEKSDFLEKAYEILRQCDSSVAQREYLRELCAMMRVDYDAAEADFLKNVKPAVASPKSNIIRKPSLLLSKVEHELLWVCLHDETCLHALATRLDFDWIATDQLGGRLLVRFLASAKENDWPGVHNIEGLLENDAEKDFVYTLLTETEESRQLPPVSELVKTAVKTLYLNFIKKQIAEVDDAIALCNDINGESFKNLCTQRSQLRRSLQNPPNI